MATAAQLITFLSDVPENLEVTMTVFDGEKSVQYSINSFQCRTRIPVDEHGNNLYGDPKYESVSLSSSHY